jgi:CHAT domain-containing protein
MKKIVFTILFIVLLSFKVIYVIAQTKQLSSAQFEEQIKQTLEKNDSTQTFQLIKNNRSHVVPFINGILNESIRERLEKKKTAAVKIDKAGQIAKIYLDIFGSDFPVKHVQLYHGWSNKHCNSKIDADSIAVYGTEHAKKGQLDKAISLWKHALKNFRQLGDEYAVAKNLYDTGKAYRHSGKQTQASGLLELAVKKAQDTENEILAGDALRELGVVSYLKGDPKGALNNWQKALAIFQESNAKRKQGVTLSHIGIYYKNKGEAKKAIQYYEKAIAIAGETNDKSELANTLNNIGNIYLGNLADYDKAKKYFMEALKIKREIGNSQFDAVIIGNIGICYKNQGDYYMALKYFMAAMKTAEKINNTPMIAKNSSDIGTIYTELGEYERALPYYEKAVSIWDSVSDFKLKVETLMNLAVNYGRTGHFSKADSIYKLALKNARKTELKHFEGDILLNLGSLNADINDYQVALNYYDSVKVICDRMPDNRQKSRLLLNYADLYYEQQEYQKSFNNFSDALNLTLKINALDFVWKAYYGKGKSYEKLGALEQAYANYDSAITYIEKIRSKLKAQSLRESYMNEKMSVYKAMINLLLKQGQNKKAYEYLQRSKSKCLLEIISNGQNRITQGISPQLLNKKRTIELKISKLQQEIADKYASSNMQSHEPEINKIEDSLLMKRSALSELLQEIELKHPKYANLTGVMQSSNLDIIQKNIVKPGSVLIDYMVGENQTIVWIIGTSLFMYEKIDIKKNELEKNIIQLLQPFHDVKNGKIKNYADIDFDLRLAEKLYSIIFQPIEKHINKENHIIIVPDEILFYLPFEMLVTSIDKKKHDRRILFSRYLNANYMIDKYSISYTQSASLLDETYINFPKFNKDKNKLLAFGNPDYGKANIDYEKDNYKSENIFDFLLRSSRGIMFSELPKSEEEVIAISKIMKPSKIYLHKEATEDLLKKHSDTSPYLHLATHCIVDENQPMFSRIVFSLDEDINEDGFLHTYEVFNLELNTDLVTLSACETGLGRLSKGEGIIGIGRAFLYAGTPSLLVSLWSVDESTSEIMKYFYKNINSGKGKARALRLAKLKLIRETGKLSNGRKFSYANPFLWAPFVLMGVWE